VEEERSKKLSKNPYALGIEILVMITSMCSTFVGITTGGRDSTIQRHSLLIAQAIVVGCRRVELHQLRVPTLSLGLATLLYVFDGCLKVALHAKGLWCQGDQELPKKLSTFIAAPSVALVLGLRVGFLQLVLHIFLFSLQSLFLFLQLFQMAFVLSHRLFRLLALCLEVANLPPQNGVPALKVTDSFLQCRNRRSQTRHF